MKKPIIDDESGLLQKPISRRDFLKGAAAGAFGSYMKFNRIAAGLSSATMGTIITKNGVECLDTKPTDKNFTKCQNRFDSIVTATKNQMPDLVIDKIDQTSQNYGVYGKREKLIRVLPYVEVWTGAGILFGIGREVVNKFRKAGKK